MSLTRDDIIGVLLTHTPKMHVSTAHSIVNSILSIQEDKDSRTDEQRNYASYLADGNEKANTYLKNLYLSDPVALNFLKEDKKIQAIKQIRALTNCTLKAAKDAVDQISFPVDKVF